ncbi:restriction endonuclease [Curtobacterium flaccumfaciens]|uniref:restriction endonuclease n=1 Tax=Curtobacterium flaccumfaciens TaxID=2035 RepID=UPI00217E45F7|nr:restriction endonuclease [Curtobacterium flaccumfaciens]MCS6589533.1 restriction endonuclease [Curtobacterium flaccumfaciens pv. flaccumfaciens]
MSTFNDDPVSAVPIWPAFVIPVLQVLEDGRTLHRKDVISAAAGIAELTTEARAETLRSGSSRYEQRVGWALSHLTKASWIDRPNRAHYAINERGRRAIVQYPDGFDYALAREIFSGFWPNKSRTSADPEALQAAILPADGVIVDPIEQIEDGISRIEAEVGEELLYRLRESHPDFFEQAVVDLLLAMGYGGAEERGKRIGGTGDEGIDGVIDQDALGLDRVYIQAKRYKAGNNIGRETIQAFVGALHGFGASRGVFLTTSAFTPAAISYTTNVQSRVILIDGERLISLMIKYRVGVQIRNTYTAVEVDADFFD